MSRVGSVEVCRKVTVEPPARWSIPDRIEEGEGIKRRMGP